MSNALNIIADATRSGARGFADGWRSKLAATLPFAMAVVIGILVAVPLGGLNAGVVKRRHAMWWPKP